MKDIVNVPVIGVGRFTDPDEMLQVVSSGQHDIIGCARPSIADPFLPEKIRNGQVEDICECIGCNQCISRFGRGGTIVCTQNATTMEEYRRGWHPERFERAEVPGKVVVVGAGPAGLECTRVLGRRGYHVDLLEASPDLGGHLRDIVRLPGLGEWGRVITWRETQLRKLEHVQVLRGVGIASAEDLLGYGADHIVLATGSHWQTNGVGMIGSSPIAGVDAALPSFATPEQVMAGKVIGQRVLILDSDGYFMGVSLAEMLGDRGHHVTLLTPFDKVCPYGDYSHEGANLRRMTRGKGIVEVVNHWVQAVELGDHVLVTAYDVYRDDWQRRNEPIAGETPRKKGTASRSIEVDTVVLCTSRCSNGTLYQDLAARRGEWQAAGIKSVTRAGDCVAPRYIADAVFDGHRVGREFESPNPERPLSIIRERQIWGQQAYPEAGLPVI